MMNRMLPQYELTDFKEKAPYKNEQKKAFV